MRSSQAAQHLETLVKDSSWLFFGWKRVKLIGLVDGYFFLIIFEGTLQVLDILLY